MNASCLGRKIDSWVY